MDLKKVIMLFYIGYTMFVIMVVNTTSIDFFTIVPALFSMWIMFLVYSVGFKYRRKLRRLQDTCIVNAGWLNNRNKLTLCLIAVLSVIFSILAVQFYTGKTPGGVFQSIISGKSLYQDYQYYFKDNNLGALTLSKIPFTFMLFYVNFITFYGYLSFCALRRKRWVDKLCVFLISLSFLYMGVARGTNFEFFEFVMLIIFGVFFLRKNDNSRVKLRSLVFVGILISSMIYVFYLVTNMRGVHHYQYISRDVFFDPDGLLPMVSPFLAFVVVLLYGYFGFGHFYMATYISNIWFLSLKNFVAGFLPFGYGMLTDISLSDTMKNLVDIGAKWQPDEIALINVFGYFGLLMFCFLLGMFSKYLHQTNNTSPIIQVSRFLVLLQMISLPIGNFISVSSSSKLMVGLLVLFWIWKIFIKVKIKCDA